MGKPKKINIEWDDLKEEPQPASQNRTFPGLSQEGRSSFALDATGGKSKKSFVYTLSEGIAIPRALAGLVGGSAAWVVTETLMSQDSASHSNVEAIFGTMVWFAAVGALIAACIRASEDIYVGRNQAAVKNFFLGSLAGALTGLASGFLAQVLYSILGGGHEGSSIFQQVLARTLGFVVAGAFLGLGISLPSGISKKIKAAALGGLIGGFAGGLCFDTVGLVIAQAVGGGGGVSRMLGLVLTGAAIGYGMGITENALRDAWLQVVAGPFQGKQFILFKKDSSIGRDPYCDIVLIKDTYVADRHCLISETPNGYRIQANASVRAQILVNGIAVTEKYLQQGDAIQVGYTQFVFRASAGKGG